MGHTFGGFLSTLGLCPSPFGYFAGIIILLLGLPPRPTVLGSCPPPWDLVDQTPRRFGRIIRTLVRHCYPPFLSGGAQAPTLPTFRATVPCSGGH